MTIVTQRTQTARLVRGAVLGAILLNVPTLVWGWFTSSTTLIIGIIAAGVLGAALGALTAWMGQPNRWGRWWSGHRRRPRSDETLPPPADLTP